ncbi:unnamed protein product [Polarella glacialis]|uniref:Protein-serine/threonine phosphatase n=1 Tax=Polarella glacialis TaxID=89957 RepID=A0A813LH56_POLGL|nr:unnamed protein product [Polarella glacialis]|mmetsp:Transcript_42317/g.68471  ORF Transcript_42317/g.68471 Transcript_42317/m.68471 type:complete len:183 (-) Transcript_42317:31-579(-)
MGSDVPEAPCLKSSGEGKTPVREESARDLFGVPEHPTAIVFLDVDGVLHSVEAHPEAFLGHQQLLLLKRILEATGARIVLSTTWRRDPAHLQQVLDALDGVGIERPIGATPDLWRAGRASEISAWLAANASLVAGQWVSLDDLPLEEELPSQHVVTLDGLLGLTAEKVSEAIAKLSARESNS